MGALARIKALGNWFQNNPGITAPAILIMLTIGAEMLVESAFFRCPCPVERARTYALVFMLAPAVLLFMASLVVNNVVWRHVHGCCYDKGCRSTDEEDATKPPTANPATSAANPSEDCWCWFPLYEYLLKPLVFPLCWVLIVLLDGDYIACGYAEDPCLDQVFKTPCQAATEKFQCTRLQSEDYMNWASDSQLWGWIAFVGLAALGIVALCCFRCCKRTSYVRHQFEEVRDTNKETVMTQTINKQSGYLLKDQCRVELDAFLKQEEKDAIALEIQREKAANRNQ